MMTSQEETGNHLKPMPHRTHDLAKPNWPYKFYGSFITNFVYLQRNAFSKKKYQINHLKMLLVSKKII